MQRAKASLRRVVFLLTSRHSAYRTTRFERRSPRYPTQALDGTRAGRQDEGASMVSPHSQLKKVTDRVIERSKPTRAAYLARIDAAHGQVPGARRAFVRESGARFRRPRRPGKDRDQDDSRAEHRHRVVVQRDAVGARAVQELPRHHQAGGARKRRRRAIRGRRAGHVRRHHAGQRRHGTVAVLARSHRDEHGGRAHAQHVRRGAVPRHLRQDRAGPADRRAAVRPSADHLRARPAR